MSLKASSQANWLGIHVGVFPKFVTKEGAMNMTVEIIPLGETSFGGKWLDNSLRWCKIV